MWSLQVWFIHIFLVEKSSSIVGTKLDSIAGQQPSFKTTCTSHEVTMKLPDSPGTIRLQRGGGGGLSNHQISLQAPSQWTELPAAACNSSQHPVNTVHLGYLLFERCDKQWQPCIVNMWAHDRFELQNCWICPENSSRVEPKCTLTQNKPLPVTEGAAPGGHGLCQTGRRAEAEEGQTAEGQRQGGVLAAFSTCIAFEWK